MEIKQELESIVRQELKLPDNAVITRASFQITNQDDEVKVIGSTAVEYQDKIDQLLDGQGAGEKYTLPKGFISEPRTKRGRKAKKEAEPKRPPLHKAKEGVGAEITEAQIKGYKATLWARENAGALTKEQSTAIKATHGIFARNLTPEQKQQIKDIFDETTPKRF